MNEKPENQDILLEVRLARAQAQQLKDQLQIEYERLLGENQLPDHATPQKTAGIEAMRKAILATNRALDNIDKALNQIH